MIKVVTIYKIYMLLLFNITPHVSVSKEGWNSHYKSRSMYYLFSYIKTEILDC